MDFFLIGLLGVLLIGVIALYSSFIIAYICHIKLFAYLKTVDYEQWRSLRSIGNGKFIGAMNFDKLREYLKSSSGETDEQILRYKDRLGFFLRMFKISILTCIIDVVIMILYLKFVK